MKPPRCFKRKKRLVNLAPESCLIAAPVYRAYSGQRLWASQHQRWCRSQAQRRGASSSELAGDTDGVDSGFAPPCGFITGSVHLAMMAPAQRHGELIAHLAPERTMLREPKVMRDPPVGAHKSGMVVWTRICNRPCHETDAAPVTRAGSCRRGWKRTRRSADFAAMKFGLAQGTISALLDQVFIGASDGCHFCRKCVLDAPRIGRRQAVFCRHDPVRPRGGGGGRAQAIHVYQKLIAQCRRSVRVEHRSYGNRLGLSISPDRRCSCSRPPFIPAILFEVTGCSGPESGTVGAVRSGASRSSSPAIPTSVKSP